ncbi:LamG domain-containing protein [Leptospira haakeii]|uniref:Concanavalin n=1 Tax=Leptospira haakeii TaxID=2023198 RepID=A0ABX4PIW3_9LEPT|nr:LamG domain-containing protein [Leptospira haakeii]PKA15722.1 concanavalin [Leptospira haakeii]PKA18595.1 concanavalin [Leptospira haakeii]
MRILLLVFFIPFYFSNCGTYLLLENLNAKNDRVFENFIQLSLLDSAIGLVHYWPLDGDTRDIIGGLDLTATSGTPTLTSDRFGFPGGAYYYDGAGGYHQSSAQGPLFFNGTISSFTVSAWVKGKYPPGNNGNEFMFLSQGAGFGLQLYALTASSCSGRLRAFTNNGSSGDVDVGTDCGKYPEDVWYHMVFTWDIQTLTASLYVNNVLVNSGTFGVNRPWATNSFFQLGLSNISSQLFEGSIDDVRIYNRVVFPVSSL